MIVTGQLLAFVVNAVIANITGGPDVVLKTVVDGTTAKVDGVQTILQAGQQYTWDAMNTVDPSLFTIDNGNGNTWRWMLLVCSIPAIALWISMRMMPESSRWHAANYQFAEAIGCLKRVRTEQDNIEEEFTEMVEASQNQVEEEKLTLKQILKVKWLRKLLIIGSLIGIFNQTTGVNTMMYYAPKVLQQAGFGTQAAITLTVLTGVASVIGSATGLFLLNKFSRRQVLIGRHNRTHRHVGPAGTGVPLRDQPLAWKLTTMDRPCQVRPLSRGCCYRLVHALHAVRKRSGNLGDHGGAVPRPHPRRGDGPRGVVHLGLQRDHHVRIPAHHGYHWPDWDLHSSLLSTSVA